MAAHVTGSDDENGQSSLQKTNEKEPDNEHFGELFDAISTSELGSILPSSICREIAEFGRIFVDSVLLTEEQQAVLVQLIESQSQTKQFENAEWKLLCRHSRDGDQFDWAYNEFHKLCDGKRNTICLLKVKETGWICGGYASAAWHSAGVNVAAKDDNAFLFVIRSENEWKVFHRKRDEDGKLLRENGILNSSLDGFNFGYNSFWWGNGYQNDLGQRVVLGTAGNYYTFESLKDLTGHTNTSWSDYEVFHLIE